MEDQCLVERQICLAEDPLTETQVRDWVKTLMKGFSREVKKEVADRLVKLSVGTTPTGRSESGEGKRDVTALLAILLTIAIGLGSGAVTYTWLNQTLMSHGFLYDTRSCGTWGGILRLSCAQQRDYNWNIWKAAMAQVVGILYWLNIGPNQINDHFLEVVVLIEKILSNEDIGLASIQSKFTPGGASWNNAVLEHQLLAEITGQPTMLPAMTAEAAAAHQQQQEQQQQQGAALIAAAAAQMDALMTARTAAEQARNAMLLNTGQQAVQAGVAAVLPALAPAVAPAVAPAAAPAAPLLLLPGHHLSPAAPQQGAQQVQMQPGTVYHQLPPSDEAQATWATWSGQGRKPRKSKRKGRSARTRRRRRRTKHRRNK